MFILSASKLGISDRIGSIVCVANSSRVNKMSISFVPYELILLNENGTPRRSYELQNYICFGYVIKEFHVLYQHLLTLTRFILTSRFSSRFTLSANSLKNSEIYSQFWKNHYIIQSGLHKIRCRCYLILTTLAAPD